MMKRTSIVDLFAERKAKSVKLGQKAIRLRDVIPLDMEDIHKTVVEAYKTEGYPSFEAVNKKIKELVEERMYARLSSTQANLIRQLVKQTLSDPALVEKIMTLQK